MLTQHGFITLRAQALSVLLNGHFPNLELRWEGLLSPGKTVQKGFAGLKVKSSLDRGLEPTAQHHAQKYVSLVSTMHE